MAFLVLLERLSPVERAVFVLHEVFELEHAEIARIVSKSEANCRQMLARAKRRVGAPQARFAADPARANRLVQRRTLRSCRFNIYAVGNPDKLRGIGVSGGASSGRSHLEG